MVQVEVLERCIGGGRRQVDAEGVRAWRTAWRADAHQVRVVKGGDERALVVRVGVRDKVCPQALAERLSHPLANAREQRAPALLRALARHPAKFPEGGGAVRARAMLAQAVSDALGAPAIRG